MAGNLEEIHQFLGKAIDRLHAERQAATEQDEEGPGPQYFLVLSETENEPKFSTLPLMEVETMYKIIGEKINANS